MLRKQSKNFVDTDLSCQLSAKLLLTTGDVSFACNKCDKNDYKRIST